MEFKFNLNDIFKDSVVEIDNSFIPPGFKGDKRALWDTQSKVAQVINAMGEASAAAQNLTKPITTSDRLRNSEHKLYFLIDQSANSGKGAVTGMLKVGQKGLYVFDRDGHHYQVNPQCVLDFYVHESRQRQGLGKHLFEHMLQNLQTDPVKMAIDRPSDKFLGFLDKHYNLNSPVKQMNNYVVFDGFFPKSREASPQVVTDTSTTPSKKATANGLQHNYQNSPYGRYGAPRPPCSMGQIIHNESSVIQKNQEATGVRSEPATNAQMGPNSYSYLTQTYATQSTPNVHFNYTPNTYPNDPRQYTVVQHGNNTQNQEHETSSNYQQQHIAATGTYEYQNQLQNQQVNIQPDNWPSQQMQQPQSTYQYAPTQPVMYQIQPNNTQNAYQLTTYQPQDTIQQNNVQLVSSQENNAAQPAVGQQFISTPKQQYQPYQIPQEQSYVYQQNQLRNQIDQPYAGQSSREVKEPLIPVATESRHVPQGTQSLPNQQFASDVPTNQQMYQPSPHLVQSAPTMHTGNFQTDVSPYNLIAAQPTLAVTQNVTPSKTVVNSNLQTVPENTIPYHTVSNTLVSNESRLQVPQVQPTQSVPQIQSSHPVTIQPALGQQYAQQVIDNPTYTPVNVVNPPFQTTPASSAQQNYNTQNQSMDNMLNPQLNQMNIQPQRTMSNTVMIPQYVQPTVAQHNLASNQQMYTTSQNTQETPAMNKVSQMDIQPQQINFNPTITQPRAVSAQNQQLYVPHPTQMPVNASQSVEEVSAPLRPQQITFNPTITQPRAVSAQNQQLYIPQPTHMPVNASQSVEEVAAENASSQPIHTQSRRAPHYNDGLMREGVSESRKKKSHIGQSIQRSQYTLVDHNRSAEQRFENVPTPVEEKGNNYVVTSEGDGERPSPIQGELPFGYPPQNNDTKKVISSTATPEVPNPNRPNTLSITAGEETNNGANDVQPNESDSLNGEDNVDHVEDEEEELKVASEETQPHRNVAEKSPTPEVLAAGKTTPGLTGQGFFDLKFYHNKLW